jgi:hypothetical protein
VQGKSHVVLVLHHANLSANEPLGSPLGSHHYFDMKSKLSSLKVLSEDPPLLHQRKIQVALTGLTSSYVLAGPYSGWLLKYGMGDDDVYTSWRSLLLL